MAMRSSRWLPLLLAPSALIALLFNAWDFVSLWLDHDQAVEESSAQCTALAREVSRYLTGMLEMVEVHLTDHLRPAAELYLTGKVKPGLQGAFLLTGKRLPQITEILVFDADGHLKESSQHNRRRDLTVGDTAFFKRHRDDGADQTVFVAALNDYQADSRGAKWQLHMASSLHSADGDFIGLVVAALDTESIFNNIGEMKIVTGASVRIFDGTGRLLVDHPRDFTQIGRSFFETTLFKTWRKTQADMVGRLPDPTDNTPEIGAFRKIGHYPLLVSVGIAEDLALAEWWRELAILLGTVVAFMLASGWSARKTLARWVLRVKDEAEAHGFRDGDGI